MGQLTYAEVHELHLKLVEAVKGYGMGPSVHTALSWLDQLSIRAEKNEFVRAIYFGWLKDGGSIVLRDSLLPIVGYDSSIHHFNAFAVLDSSQQKM